MKMSLLLLSLALVICGENCNNLRYSGRVLDAKIVENKTQSYVVKLITDRNLYYIETNKKFLVTENDSIYICWVNYSGSFLIINNKQYKIIRQYIEHY